MLIIPYDEVDLIITNDISDCAVTIMISPTAANIIVLRAFANFCESPADVIILIPAITIIITAIEPASRIKKLKETKR